MTEPGQATTWKPWVTYALIAANLAGFAYELSAGVSPIKPLPVDLVAVGGNLPVLTLGGEPWRLLTAMFLHAGVIHIAMNMLCLYQLRIVERLLGRASFAALYLAAGLGGGLLSAARSTPVVSVGASGAVFGLVGGFGAYLLSNRRRLDEDAVKRQGRSLLSFLGLNVMIGFSMPSIDMSAHLGGLLAGAAAGLALTLRPGERGPRPVRAVLVTVLALGLTAGALQVMPHPHGGKGLFLGKDTVAAAKTVETTEHRTLVRYNALREQARATPPTISDAELADALDNELLPPWRDALAQLTIPDDDLHGKRLMTTLQTLVRTRIRAWEQFALALRDLDETSRAKEIEAYKAAEHELIQLGFDYKLQLSER
jgi:rhomboid protease GluP